MTFQKPADNYEIWFDRDGESICFWFNNDAVGVWNGITDTGFVIDKP